MNSLHYLKRIGFAGSINTDLHSLNLLQEHHVFSVPFENLDIQAGIPIHLSRMAFYDKIVIRRRGGYCYEINSLFHQLLIHLGFKAYLISARIKKGKGCGPEYDHLAIVVHLDGEVYLVDAGYGDFSFKPLLIKPGLKQFDGRSQYVINEEAIDGKSYFSVAKWNSGRHNFVTEYYFSTTARSLEEFEERNSWQQSSPDSHFTQNLICSLPTHNGRISIINGRLITTIGATKTESHIDPAQLTVFLQRYFDINLDLSQNRKSELLQKVNVTR